jgi:hypothetical protein
MKKLVKFMTTKTFIATAVGAVLTAVAVTVVVKKKPQLELMLEDES